MGRIDEYTRRVYAEILMGFIRKDYRRVAEVHFEAGYVPADRDIDEFARALRAVGEPIFGMDASRISMARLLAYLFDVTERFGMQTRTELILLQRTMVVVEGVARSLDPHINIWQVARPVVESYIAKSIGPAALLRDLVQTARVLAPVRAEAAAHGGGGADRAGGTAAPAGPAEAAVAVVSDPAGGSGLCGRDRAGRADLGAASSICRARA
jgi:predicted unusual protein kinase regulating ubiquinone biosynthesis (AarF/ABC1/UbiB family)